MNSYVSSSYCFTECIHLKVQFKVQMSVVQYHCSSVYDCSKYSINSPSLT